MESRRLDKYKARSGDLAQDADGDTDYNGFSAGGSFLLLIPNTPYATSDFSIDRLPGNPWFYGDKLAGALNLLEPA